MQLSDWARDIPNLVWPLAAAFWPGPLTLILAKQAGVADLITGGQDSIGIRMPAHPLARAVLAKFGRAVAAPSANKFGHISPTTAAAVREELGDAVDFILDGGQCSGGLESTILDLTRGDPTILRPGLISASAIETVIKLPVTPFSAERPLDAPRVSGALASHYAPHTPLRLISSERINALAHADFSNVAFPLAILVFRKRAIVGQLPIRQLHMSADAATYAHDLYQVLRKLDHQHFKEIWVEVVPPDAAWEAVRDRLQRASLKESYQQH